MLMEHSLYAKHCARHMKKTQRHVPTLRDLEAH